MRELLSGFAEPSVSLARELGRIARSRSVAHGGEVQPEPEMFVEGSVELFQWRREYGGEGRKSTWPVTKKDLCASHATDQCLSTESFALDARTPEKPKRTTTEKRPSKPMSQSFSPTIAAKADTSTLSAAHHEAAAKWPDKAECLEWAAEQEATVKEMIAWRNLQTATA
jgi:hypothetical protein